MNNYKEITENIRKITKDYIVKNNLKSLVLGVSGGIDSALVAVLLKPICDELKIPLIGKSITIETNKKEEIARSIAIGENFCTHFEHIDLTEEYKTLKNMVSREGVGALSWADPNTNIFIEEKETEIQYKIRLGNIKARMRMIYLYDLAQKNKGMTLGTDQLSEWYLSYFTIHGDHFDWNPIHGLWKTEVYELSEWLIDNELKSIVDIKALRDCINAVPTDGLGITNSDLDQIEASSYSDVDKILQTFFTTGEILNEKVIERYKKGEFKRNWPFSIGRDEIF